MAIYTKKGDSGKTDNLRGNRISKSNSIIELIGTVDELTSQLGVAKPLMDTDSRNEISKLQEELIEIMAYISSGFERNSHLSPMIGNFEQRIDAFELLYPDSKSFILPGDDSISATLDLARTISRKSERKLIKISEQYQVPKDIKCYFNRLSDYLYAMARMIAFRQVVKEQLKLNDSSKLYENSLEIPGDFRTINLEIAGWIARQVQEKANENKCRIVVSIVNGDGAPILTRRMDDAFVVSFGLARKKAFTAAMLKMPTHELGILTAEGGAFHGLQSMIDEEIVTLGGGYPIMVNKQVVGAIGVSGATTEDDMLLAEYGSLLLETM